MGCEAIVEHTQMCQMWYNMIQPFPSIDNHMAHLMSMTYPPYWSASRLMAAPHQAVAQRQDLSHKAHGQDLVALGAAHHASEHRQKDVQGGTWRPGKDGRLQAA
jgi:hypothetical protein